MTLVLSMISMFSCVCVRPWSSVSARKRDQVDEFKDIADLGEGLHQHDKQPGHADGQGAGGGDCSLQEF